MSILALKRPYNCFFGAKKSVIAGKSYAGLFSFVKNTESHNALFDAEKCDIGPKNTCNWKKLAEFPVS